MKTQKTKLSQKPLPIITQKTNFRKDKKTLALIQGDPAGIGPELLVKLLVDPAIREAANLIVVGDPRILARGEQQVGLDIPNLRQIDAEDPLKITEGEVLHLNIAIDGMADAPMNAASAAGGAASDASAMTPRRVCAPQRPRPAGPGRAQGAECTVEACGMSSIT